MDATFSPAEPVVAVCASFADAQRVADALVARGVDRANLSVVGSGNHLTSAATMDARLRKWSRVGSTWGALGGLAAGAVLAVPSFGAVLAIGPITALLLAALEGAALGGGISVVAAALTGSGMTGDDAMRYEREIAARRYLVLVHGTHGEVDAARAMLVELGFTPPAGS